MKVWLGKDIQMKLAAAGLCIPMVKGAPDAIQNPFCKALALEVNYSDWICNAMDQLLRRDTGRVFNDEAAAVAFGAQSPEEATKTIEGSAIEIDKDVRKLALDDEDLRPLWDWIAGLQ